MKHEKAVNFWISKIGKHHDNGAGDKTNLMAMILADALADKNKPSEDAINKFANALDKIIDDELTKHGRIELSVDYHPNMYLSEASRIAGISEIVFPYKTNMIVTNSSVEVSDGYGVPFVSL